MSKNCLSHVMEKAELDKAYAAANDRIKKLSLTPEEIQKRLSLLEAMLDFPLGQFILINGGVDGEMSEYVFGIHPKKGRITGLNNIGEKLTELEDFILNRAPVALAAQERAAIFIEELQKRCEEGVALACVPAGVLWELYSLDVSKLLEFRFIGVDIDLRSLEVAKNKCDKKGLLSHTELYHADAWECNFPQKVDVIVSNGLTIYEPDDEKVYALYQKFYENLKSKGVLITSYLTPPPPFTDSCEWDFSQINLADLEQQKVLFVDVIPGKWQCYRSTKTTIQLLEQSGFEIVEIRYDRARIFPTIIAEKPE